MKVVHSEGIVDVLVNFPKFEGYLKEHDAISYAEIGKADSIVCDESKTLEALVPLYKKAQRKGIELCRDMTPLREMLEF